MKKIFFILVLLSMQAVNAKFLDRSQEEIKEIVGKILKSRDDVWAKVVEGIKKGYASEFAYGDKHLYDWDGRSIFDKRGEFLSFSAIKTNLSQYQIIFQISHVTPEPMWGYYCDPDRVDEGPGACSREPDSYYPAVIHQAEVYLEGHDFSGYRFTYQGNLLENTREATRH